MVETPRLLVEENRRVDRIDIVLLEDVILQELRDLSDTKMLPIEEEYELFLSNKENVKISTDKTEGVILTH